MPEDIEEEDYHQSGRGTTEKTAGRIVKMNEWLESDKWLPDWLEENEEWLKNQDRLDEDVEDLEPADLSPEDKLEVTIKKAQEEFEGVKDERILRSYVHAVYGEGEKSGYENHPRVKDAAGSIGRYLTDKTFFHKVVDKKVFDQFIENPQERFLRRWGWREKLNCRVR